MQWHASLALYDCARFARTKNRQFITRTHSIINLCALKNGAIVEWTYALVAPSAIETPLSSAAFNQLWTKNQIYNVFLSITFFPMNIFEFRFKISTFQKILPQFHTKMIDFESHFFDNF